MKTLSLFMFLLLFSSCRDSVPPAKEVCILNGVGLGDCVEANGAKVQKTPSQMNNYWCTNQADMANWAGWCYDATPSATKSAMKTIKSEIRN